MWKDGLIHHAVFVLGAFWPAMLICRRAGLNPLWALSLCVPIFGLVCFTGVLAFQRWPEPSQSVPSQDKAV